MVHEWEKFFIRLDIAYNAYKLAVVHLFSIISILKYIEYLLLSEDLGSYLEFENTCTCK